MHETKAAEHYSMHRIVGEQLSAVIFVMDYLQLMFNSDIMNVIAYPRVIVDSVVHLPDKPGYRDTLCERITNIVVKAEARKGDAVQILFDENSSIYIPVKDEIYLYGPEFVMYQADRHKYWWLL